jgi:TRAP-type C4-dicarboxylate transport system substrate-binding protein
MLIKRTTLVAVAAAAFMTAGPAQSETVLRVSNWLPPTHPITTDIIQVWANNVEKESAGRVKVQILSALGKPEAHFDLVRRGVADVAMGVDGYTPDRFKLTYGVKLPFIADDSTAATVAYWRVHQRYFAKHNEFGGVKLITLWVHGPGYLHTSSRKIQSMDDMKNLKVRVSGGVIQEVAASLGMVPQFAPASQAYELLSNGVVDGILFNMDSIPSFKIDKVLNNVLMVPGGLYRDSHFMIMNEAKFKSLPKADQDAIDKVSNEAQAWVAGRAWDAADGRALKGLKERSYNFIEPSPQMVAQLKEKLAPLEQKWMGIAKEMGLDGREVLEAYKAEIKKVKAEMAKR